MIENFTIIDRGHSKCWLHNTKPAWIVFYDTTHRQPFYEAYAIKDYVGGLGDLNRGRMPWTYDNRKLSSGDGFRTLEDAMKAAEGVEA